MLLVILAGWALAGQSVALSADPVPKSGEASSAQVGAAMAVLATLEQAQVLPPEGTGAATRIVQSVIQFQSAFTQSGDPGIQAFTTRAVAARFGEQAAGVLAQSKTAGWTAELLEALADAEAQAAASELQALAPGFSRYNMSVEEFHRFMELIRAGRRSLAQQGLDFQRVYAEHRRAMPGAKSRGTQGRSGAIS